MSDKKEVLLEVNGLVIKTNSIYRITNKPDKTAPSGFVREGTTKLPSNGIGNTVACRFQITNKSKGTGVFDTGLYPGSPMYSTMNAAKAEAQVNMLKEAIVVPYERKYGRGTLDHSNEDFWQEFGVELFDGRYFVTSKPEDLLDLYVAMSGFDLTPKDQIGNPKFSQSQYCIEDKEKVQTIKSERANETVDAFTSFGMLLATDREKLINVLRYMKVIGVGDTIDDNTLKPLFHEWLNKGLDHATNFNKTVELAQNESTSDIVNLYAIVSRLAIKNKFDKVNGEYFYKGTSLGLDLKSVAKNLNDVKELQEIKIELIEME